MFDRRGSQQPVMGSPARSSTPTHSRAKSLSAMGHLGQSGSGTASVPMSPSASSSATRQYTNPTTGQSSPVVGGVPMSPAASGWTLGTPGTPGPSLGRETEWSDIQGRTFCKWLNTKLEAKDLEPMTDLVKDFSSGVKLIELLEIMSDQSLGRYNKKPIMRVQKAENASKALQFIRDSGVKLTNIGPEDIVDGNRKLILGMVSRGSIIEANCQIWTLILRFTMANITEEGLSAKDGLLLWCQRKTQGYSGVDVQNFKQSFADGLALCALIHKHRPELLDYDKLDPNDRRSNTELALSVAEEALGIPRLLEAKDLCDLDVPDERSVMTYVAEFFHRFSQEDKMETGARRIEKFAEVLQSVILARNDFERRLASLLQTLEALETHWENAARPTNYPDAMATLADFAKYKQTDKRAWVKERQELSWLYSNIQTKIKTYGLRSWEPREGSRLTDMEKAWSAFLAAEGARSRAINATIRGIKEDLRKQFAEEAEEFAAQLRRIEQVIGTLQGSLADQQAKLMKLMEVIPHLRSHLSGKIAAIDQACQEAKVEENDYTGHSVDDLEYELELAEVGVKQKIAFVENQMVASTKTNITPAKLEEFESTFKHFDKDGTNTLMLWEMHSALASLGIVYADEELQVIYSDLESAYGAVTFEAWLALLTDITKDDISSPNQLREAFRSMAGDKSLVSELDLQEAHLPKETIRFLTDIMTPSDANTSGAETLIHAPAGMDFEAFLAATFARS